jgi:hypothetical protein
MASNSADSSQAQTNWVSSLSVLPAKERLAWQKTISADVVSQQSIKPSILSRSYVNGATEDSGDSIFGSVSSKSSSESKVPYVSINDMLTKVLDKAIQQARISKRDDVALPVDLSASITAAKLDSAYTTLLAKYFTRKLPIDSAWIEEQKYVAASNPETGTSRFEAIRKVVDPSFLSSSNVESKT